ncbi:branched-chain amino acid ABC transporter substrate-binding protein [Mycolicibacterium pulveris]|uniref:branched-chain amino acid ABC transporter substrate-binding protein n=1 Tax=Mycolicibacterium pulveris TaxID=36813 RepID=UPI003CF35BD3
MHRRSTRSALVVGLASVTALGMAACGTSSPGPTAPPSDLEIVAQQQIDATGVDVGADAGAAPADPAGDGNAVCPPVSIAMAGPLTGPDAALGVGIKNGVQLAVDEHNAANPACQVQLKPFDTEGDARKAEQIAPRVVEDAYTIGLVGPVFSDAATATGEVFDRAGLVAATPSATDVALSAQGWRTFFRGSASDAVQGPAVANYMTGNLGYRKVCVVDDSTDYGLGLAMLVRETLGAVADSDCNIAVKRGDTDFSGAVTLINTAEPDSVFFSGRHAEAAPLVRQLRDAGFAGRFLGSDGTKNTAFVEQAGAAAADAVLSCPCSPATPEFAEEYSREFGVAPGPYSVEAYDLGTILLRGIDAGAITRPALLDYVRTYDGRGIARAYKWADNGDLDRALNWIYRVE